MTHLALRLQPQLDRPDDRPFSAGLNRLKGKEEVVEVQDEHNHCSSQKKFQNGGLDVIRAKRSGRAALRWSGELSKDQNKPATATFSEAVRT